MPNWCDNRIDILAKKEINDSIKQNVDAYLGRRADDSVISETCIPYEKGEEIWSQITITVRTGWAPPVEFINHVLQTYPNVILKGHYWIEGGMGAADFEMSSDDSGHVEYHSHEEINQDYMTEEELEELSEKVTLEELGSYDPKKRDLDYLFDQLKDNLQRVEKQGRRELIILYNTFYPRYGKSGRIVPKKQNEAEQELSKKYKSERDILEDKIKENKKQVLYQFVQEAEAYI